MTSEEQPVHNRFIQRDDPRMDSVVFDLPKHWWSRPYEYAWALGQVSAEETVLDAACGICHPLKLALAEKCREVTALDFDPRIASTEAILEDVRREAGAGAAEVVAGRYLNRPNLRLVRGSLFSLPFADGVFERVICISALEHLFDARSLLRYAGRSIVPPGGAWHRWLDRRNGLQISAALAELARVLHPRGRMLLTFDYPVVNLQYLGDILPELGLEFDGGYSFQTGPRDAATWHRGVLKLRVFRCVLKRTVGS